MPRVADYAVITDGQTTLQTGGDIDKDFDFTLESGAHLGSRSILAFVLLTSAANNPEFQIKINGTAQLSYGIFGVGAHTLHEVIDANVLKAGSNNNIAIKIIGGSGKLVFGDIVLHYQRDI